MKRRQLFICILFLIFAVVQVLVAGKGVSADADVPKKPETYTDSLSFLKEGRHLLGTGEYKPSLEKLKIAHTGLPVIGDYILFFMAEARSKLKEFDASNTDIDRLLKSYPDTPLRKKARSLQIRNSLSIAEMAPEESNNNNIIRAVEEYLTDYADDSETAFLYGRLLKKNGERDKARGVFKRIYIANTPYSEAALQELGESDVTAYDMLEKATGLIKVMEYKKAEVILRKTLQKSDGRLKDDLYRQLGTALFRQKRYKEAGELFLKLDDTYNATRSLFRAGDFDAFTNNVTKLVSAEDRRAGPLLTAYASKKRRDGSTEEALRIFSDVRNRYPSDAEEALWGIAWVHYRTGEYRKAADILTELYDKYHNSKYIYWKAVSLNTAYEGETNPDRESVSKTLLKAIKSNDRDFYGILTVLDGKAELQGINSQQSATLKHYTYSEMCGRDRQSQPQDIARNSFMGNTGSLPDPAQTSRQEFEERFNILMEIGMKDEAASEMMRAASGNALNADTLLYFSHRLSEAGAYKKAISLVSRLNTVSKATGWNIGLSEADLTDILYPMAYWPVVNESAKQNNIDPFILLSVMREESRFDPEASSIAGALGLMQIMPHAAFRLNKVLNLDIPDKSRLHDVRINITLGAYYLKALLHKFNSLPAVLASYNAGEEKVIEWLRSGNYKSPDEFIEDIPYDETRNYVKRVIVTYYTYRQLAAKNRHICMATGN